MKKLTREELIALVEEIITCEKSEEEICKMVSFLKKNVVDPEITDYIYWAEMTSEEIVDKALSYQPILL